MNKIIDQYHQQKQYLSAIKIKNFEYLDLGKVLATQIWKNLNRPNKEIIKKLISFILCNKYRLSINRKENNHGRYLLSASAGSLRGDNQVIIQNGKSFIEPCSEISLKKENLICIHLILKKIITTFIFYKKFNGINNNLHRAYLAANMTIIFQLSDELDDELKNVRFLLTFMDTDIFENYITQTVQNNGGKVAALQHGQRFFINEPCDSYVGMDNMSANYKLVWSKFSRNQYLKAGYKKENLPVVGSTKYLKTPKRLINKQTNTIGIFLDGPFSYGSKISNRDILEIVIEGAQLFDFRCIIKPHPVDRLDNYGNITEHNNISIAEPEQSIESLSNEIDFGIVHTSGVAIDLLILDVPVLVFKSNAIFPIELPNNYFFKSKNEFFEILAQIRNKRENFFENFEDIRKQYIENDPYQLHKEFFSQFGDNI